MSKEEILKKALDKASEHGYPKPDNTPFSSWKSYVESKGFYRAIFSHKFAKAFWGRKVIDNDFADEEGCSDPYVCDLHCGEAWEYHLRKMVLSDDPLKYLEKFLNKK